ncbi:MAG: EthD domain-containing protein [Frankia sp.]|nr:EthD domain-containing protein [Frankia sp.]
MSAGGDGTAHGGAGLPGAAATAPSAGLAAALSEGRHAAVAADGGEILLFLFTRKEGLSDAEFRNHYLGVHAPMSVAHSTATGRYVVRLVEGGAGPVPVDAITEIWTESVDAFIDPAKGWDSAENWKTVLDDANSFLSGFHMYRVRRQVLGAAEPATVPGEPGPDGRSPGVVLAHLVLDDPGAGPAAGAAGGDAPWSDDDLIPGTVRYEVIQSLAPDGPPLRAVELVALPDATAAHYRRHTFVLGEYVQKEQ